MLGIQLKLTRLLHFSIGRSFLARSRFIMYRWIAGNQANFGCFTSPFADCSFFNLCMKHGTVLKYCVTHSKSCVTRTKRTCVEEMCHGLVTSYGQGYNLFRPLWVMKCTTNSETETLQNMPKIFIAVTTDKRQKQT